MFLYFYSFYIILRGIVAIHINTDLNSEQDQEQECENEKRESTEQQTIFKENGELDRSKFGNYIARLGW